MPKSIAVEFINEGNGPEVNVLARGEHPEVKLESLRSPITIGKQETVTLELTAVVGTNFPDLSTSDPQTPVLVLAHYEDIEGNHWLSTLEIGADLTPGRTQVAAASQEHGENSQAQEHADDP